MNPVIDIARVILSLMRYCTIVGLYLFFTAPISTSAGSPLLQMGKNKHERPFGYAMQYCSSSGKSFYPVNPPELNEVLINPLLRS